MASTLIEAYRSRPGEHCGSTAMRNLLAHYCGLDLDEAVVFGLGSALDCLFIESEAVTPSVLCFGRSVTLEVDVAIALGIDYREQPDLDDARAWQAVRQEVLKGRPTMLSGDAFYLDYRDFGVHFPAHRFVLVGFDDDTETALVMDRLAPEPQRCDYRALARSRNPPDFISTYNLWGKFYDTRLRHTLAEAYAGALARNARRMLGADPSQGEAMRMVAAMGLGRSSEPGASGANSGGRSVEVASGLEGMRRLATRLPGWRDRDDCATVARYAAQTIEKYGTGGGNFRKLYAAFLAAARDVVPERVGVDLPDLAARSATTWTALSVALDAAGADRDDDAAWAECAALAGQLVELEQRLFDSLGRATGI